MARGIGNREITRCVGQSRLKTRGLVCGTKTAMNEKRRTGYGDEENQQQCENERLPRIHDPSLISTLVEWFRRQQCLRHSRQEGERDCRILLRRNKQIGSDGKRSPRQNGEHGRPAWPSLEVIIGFLRTGAGSTWSPRNKESG